MSSEPPHAVETDPRFPSGRWLGFFLDARVPGRHQMELDLTFRDEVLTGEGRDIVGEFLIRGRYELEEGRCHWSKQYVGSHSVAYRGFNEGKGIWGTWELGELVWKVTGGFHIWPEGMADPTGDRLKEEADAPLPWESLDDDGLFGGLEPADVPLTVRQSSLFAGGALTRFIASEIPERTHNSTPLAAQTIACSISDSSDFAKRDSTKSAESICPGGRPIPIRSRANASVPNCCLISRSPF